VPAKLGYTFDHESFEVEYLHEARPSAWPEARRALARGATTAAHRLLLCTAALACVGLAIRARGSVERQARLTQTGVLFGLAALATAGALAEAPTFWPVAIVACVLPWVRVRGRPSAPPALLMSAGLVATVAAAHAVFFGEDRYHVVATPALCLLAAAALREPGA
jgi:hypothetical protein